MQTEQGHGGVRTGEGESWTRWIHEIRRIELESVVEHVRLGAGSTVLELGSGDGFQLALLRQRFAPVFSIDPDYAPAAHAERFAYAAAEALPFRDETFNLVFSNCVLEHLNDRRRGLEELVRVLRPGGYMAHVVPARFWKAASLCLNPIGYPLRVAEKWHAMRKLARQSQTPEHPRSGARSRPGVGEALVRWARPPIHGTYGSHPSEYLAYGRDQWSGFFNHPDLIQVAIMRLLCATQFGFLRFRFVPLRKRLGELGLNASWAFVMMRAV
ncbi:MAG: class I SAM-dependent methyltransferase [Terriglobia bacterium]